MKPTPRLVTAIAVTALSFTAYTQEPNANDPPVSRRDYLKLKEDHDRLKQDLETLKSQMQELLKKGAPPANASLATEVEELKKKAATQQAENDQAMGDMEKQLKDVRQMAKDSFPGTTKMLLAGYGSATFTASGKGYGPSQPLPPDSRDSRDFFTATFNPIFLWKLSDRLLFEGEMELELEGSETSTALEMAQISYVANDYMTFGAGKFLNPMDYFVERQHMAWVNKLPDKPLAVYDGLLPESLLGLQIRGGVPVGPTKFGYAFYVANAPEMVTAPSDPTNPNLAEAGTLSGEDFDNLNNRVAVGGRVGFYPLPELEIGYGFQVADVGENTHSLLQSADLTYVKEFERLYGTLNLHGQWVWSHVDNHTFDFGAGPFSFNNNRNGGYAQIAYRPTRLENPILKNLEPVFRYDAINQQRTPVGFDEWRWTVGLNYWFTPSAVAKIAYERDRQNGTGESGDAMMVQFAVGF